MDLVWDASHPKYLQFTGGSVDESDSSDDEDDVREEADKKNKEKNKEKNDASAPSSIASIAAAAVSSRRRGSAPSSWEQSKLQRRLGGVGGGENDAVQNGVPGFSGPAWTADASAGDTPRDVRDGINAKISGSYEWSDGDPVWDIICTLAKKDAASEPLLSSYMYMSVLSHDTLEQAVSFVLANRLADSTLLPTQLMEIFNSVLFADDEEGVFVRSALRQDIKAIRDRDPACASYVHALLYLKGFHALQAHRVQHALWNRGQKLLALTLQARISTVFAVDMHPAARLGKGILIDHGTGVVIGETAVVGDNVSILQGVTLGGTGKDVGDRHPKIGRNVLIGAHSTILGNIKIGKGAMIAAGSLVLKPVAPHVMVAGAPAREVGRASTAAPALDMKQELNSGAEAAAGVEAAAEKGAGSLGDGDVNAATQGTASKASANVVRVRVTGGGKGTGSLADRIPEGESSWYI
jgi:serine O-acetyltransferase